jgi:hypothetical protein
VLSVVLDQDYEIEGGVGWTKKTDSSSAVGTVDIPVPTGHTKGMVKLANGYG